MEVEKLQTEDKNSKKSPQSKKDDSDFITDIIGQFGPFHAVTFTIMGLSIVIHCWQMMANKFYTYQTDFWCARPQSFQNHTQDQWRNLSAPKILDEYDRCAIFEMDYSYSNLVVRPGENTSLRHCNAWE